MTLGDRLWTGVATGGRSCSCAERRVFLAPESELGRARPDARHPAALPHPRERPPSGSAVSTGTRSSRWRPRTSRVTFETPGVYRVDVDEEGNTRVSVRQGRAWAAAAGGQVALERGRPDSRLAASTARDYDIVSLARADSWDRWVDRRARRFRSVRSASYVHPDIYGVDDLDAYGSWAEHVRLRLPSGTREAMAAGWEPYRSGRWIWRDPWGWTWLSVRAVGLGAVPLRPLGRRVGDAGAGSPSDRAGPLPGLLTGPRRLRRRRSGLVRLRLGGRASSAGSRSGPASRSTRGGTPRVRR